MTEVIETSLATQQDIKDLKQELIQLEYRLTIKLGTIVIVSLATMATIMKFF